MTAPKKIPQTQKSEMMQGKCASQCTPEFWLLIIQIKDLLEHTSCSLSKCSGFLPMKIRVGSGMLNIQVFS